MIEQDTKEIETFEVLEDTFEDAYAAIRKKITECAESNKEVISQRVEFDDELGKFVAEIKYVDKKEESTRKM